MAKIAFTLLAVTSIFLATVSLFPAYSYFYTSSLAVALWSATAFASILAIIRAKLWKRPAVLLLHGALIIILAGAMVTHLYGKSERMHLSIGESGNIGDSVIELESFIIEYYPATSAPSDFVATVSIDGSDPVRVSMNHTADSGDFRLFLTACDADQTGCTLTVTRDSAGTAISYAGYLLLVISMLVTWIKPRRIVTAAAIITSIFTTAAASPRSIPRPVADELGNLFVSHNDRVAPLSTLARDFTMKIYGSETYAGLSSEQVLAGWLFFYDDWKSDEGILIKDRDSRARMGLVGNRAKLTDFFDSRGYLFEDAGHKEANEKFALVSSAAAGSIWKLFPSQDAAKDGISPTVWYSPVDNLPEDIDIDSWRMIRHSLSYLAELVAQSDWQETTNGIRKIAKYQRLKCGDPLPSINRVRAERLFLSMSGSLWPIVLLTFLGIILIFRSNKLLSRLLLSAGIIWVGSIICLNAYAMHHLPMGNGFETMQWMACFALALCLILGNKFPQIMPFGAIVAGLALAVALMGQRTPQLTNLMPVLRSPLLSIHVMTMMLAYALLAIMALISAAWLCGHQRELLPVARRLLFPAVFLLAAGIFIGAVWANMSWGRYWGWDAKEVWALITLIVYSYPLHRHSLPCFKRDRTFAIWTLASFSTVLMTYLGVNFVLGGLHSYA